MEYSYMQLIKRIVLMDGKIIIPTNKKKRTETKPFKVFYRLKFSYSNKPLSPLE